MSKRKTAMLGTFFGIINIMVSAIGGIVIRRFFVESLGTEYLGLTAIFSNMLGILLSLDGGVAGSLLYKIYKPISDGDENRIAKTFKLIKSMYLLRACIIATVGMIAIKFLPILCGNTSIDMSYIYKAYFVYLILTSLSYYLILYSFLLEAFQKRYLVSILSGITYLVSIVLQIVLLFSIKSYLLYLIVSIMQPIILYVICRVIVKKQYSFIFSDCKLSKEDIRDIPQYLKMAIHTLGTVIASYTDAFLITAFTGIVTLGLFDNYKIITSKVSALLDQVTSSIKDPMRLLIAEGNKKRVEEMLGNINFLLYVIAGFCSLLYLALITPFVKLWLGYDYVLSYAIAVTSSYTIFLAALNYITVDTYYYVGCFKKDKKSPVVEILVNLSISFFLGRIIGIPGVLIGTVFYYYTQEFLRSRKLYNDFFCKTYFGYFVQYCKYSVMQLFLIIITAVFQMKISVFISPVWEMAVNFIFVITILTVSIKTIYRKSPYYKYLLNVFDGFIFKAKNRMKFGGE